MEQRYSLSPQAQQRIKKYIAEKASQKNLSQEDFKQQICQEATELILKQNSASYKNEQGLKSTEIKSLIRKGILPKGSNDFCSHNCHLTNREVQDFIKYDRLRATGTSESTLKRFINRENVSEISFKAFCKVLNQKWTEVINQPLTLDFKRALLRLNHTEQGQTFSQFTTRRSPCCNAPLLIHNFSPDPVRLKWLIWYLLEDNLTNCQDEYFVFFDLAGSLNWDINSLWHRLKEKFGSDKDNDNGKIAKNLAKKLQKQHIVLVFYGVDNVDNSYLNNLFVQLWQPLLKAVEKTPPAGYLLMCLVDRQETPNDWQDSLDKSFKICQLSVVNQFTLEDLEKWLKEKLVLNILKAKYTEWSAEMRQQLLEQTKDGNPESVLKAIYGSEWETQKYLWRKLD